MRIGCLQFAPQVGDVNNNLNRADAVLLHADPLELDGLDLLVLPEMAFSGYNFKSKEEIMPHLEPAGAGISALWARTTALKYDCKVVVGYPEKADSSSNWKATSQYYNSLLMVNEDGETIANYRKQHLYCTDETWSSEGTGGFFEGDVYGLGKTAMGICMDINPYKFEAPWHKFEFAYHVLDSHANVVIISMAWTTLESREVFCNKPYEPDMDTLEYWARRMEPLIRADLEDEIILIFANRCGIEGDTLYAGTSAVMGVLDGEVSLYGVLGRGTKHLLIVDTDEMPFAKLVSRPGRHAAEDEWDSTKTSAAPEAEEELYLIEDDLGSLLDLHMLKDPVEARPSAPVQNSPVDYTLFGCVPEVAEETEDAIESEVKKSEVKKPAAEDISKWAEGISGEPPSDIPRADSPILDQVRPRLTIVTAPTPDRSAKNLFGPESGSRTGPAQEIVTPPRTGDSADRQDQMLSAVTNLQTPDEPNWPKSNLSVASSSKNPSPLDSKPLPLPPPLEGTKPLPLLPQEVLLSRLQEPFQVSDQSKQRAAPRAESSSKDLEPAVVKVRSPLTAVLEAKTMDTVQETAKSSSTKPKADPHKRDSGMSEISVSIGISVDGDDETSEERQSVQKPWSPALQAAASGESIKAAS